MPTAVINHPHARVRLENQTLMVWVQEDPDQPPRLQREIPLRDLERVVLGHTVHVSGPAMSALLEAGVPIQVFSWNGRFLGGFLPAENHHGLSRLRQYQRSLDPKFCLEIAGRLVTAKLYNQRRMLQRLGASRGWLRGPEAGGVAGGSGGADEAAGTALRADLAWLDGRFRDVARAGSVDELRGHEGVCTARYFLAWARFLPAEFPFTGRTIRPPLDPVNACISFGATLLYSEAVAFCHAHGLDPALGTLHSTTDGRWSLALDLIEPFRP
ncbi:MAG: CRISPR-associated endonuclease Cas1, partial [Verrucomicrobia bacterium]